MTANTSVVQTSPQLLKGYIQRLENLAEQKAEIAQDFKDVLNEAESEGFDKKAIREVLRRRKKSRAEIIELETIVETYEAAL